MYFEDSCRDFTVDRKLDLVVYTGIYVKFEKQYNTWLGQDWGQP